MSRTRENASIQAELQRLVGLKLLTPEERQRIAARYPTTPWDVASLIRWFVLLGAVTLGAGVLVLVPKVVELQNAIDAGLALGTAGFIALGLWLERRRGLPKTGAALQLVGSFALQGFITAMAVRFSTGSKDWPALIWVCAAAIAVLAYALRHRLVLVHASVNAFVAFGGSTGYASDWGMYWLKMDYPTRFVLASLVVLAVGWAHARWLRGALQSFSRVYAHLGLLSLNLALWFLALFGRLDDANRYGWDSHSGERLVFSAVWAAVCVGLVFAGARLGQRVARGYGMTFLILNIYTFYFQFVAYHSGALWFIHMLLVGGSMVGLGVWVERRFSARKSAEPPAAGAAPTA